MSKLKATVSADVVASSSLSANEIKRLTDRISEILAGFKGSPGISRRFSPRLVMGDTMEFYVDNPNEALRVALILKSGIKSFRPDESKKYGKEIEKLRKLFETYGVRVAIGIGEMKMNLLKVGILNGSAINISGRLIADQKTSNQERVRVKNTLFIGSVNEDHTYVFQPVMSLLDTLFNKMTVRQSEIVYRKLSGCSESDIAKEFGVTQSSVNQHSTGAGWNSIEEALNLFYTFDFNAKFVPRLKATLENG